jgi:SAM-dependent methyltransferase
MTQPVIPLNPRNGWLGWWPDGGVRALLDPENGRIRAFLVEEAARLSDGARVLDAGAGTRPFAALFARQHYESCDMPGGFYAAKHDFECLLHAVPRPDSTYDAIVLTQVLEHVPDPCAVLKELHRVLKPGGVVLASLPLNGPLHGEPWHFFQFTHYGLEQLALATGLEVLRCEKIGGAFWFLGKHAADTPRRVMKQMDPFRARRRGQSVAACVAGTLLFLPFWLLSLLLMSVIARPLCYWLDRLDGPKALTSGYTVVFRKPLAAESNR